jgi:gamma-glutamyltranspeptidase/glutathione hydrolase
VKVPVAELLSPDYARRRAAEIRPDAITPKVAAGAIAKQESPSTTSLSVVDAHGNMVALTQTISDFFGAKVVVDGTGIILNNEMKNFSSRGPNTMAPGKRMRTMIAPTILLKDGTAFATLGTPGAARIVSTMTLLVSNLVDFGMGMQEAIEAPRFYARDTDADLSVEARMPAATTGALAKMGYSIKTLRDFDLFFGGAQGIVIDPKTGLRIGGADPRRDGAVVGY